MTYIRIDPQQGASVGHTMVDAGNRSMAALQRLSAAANSGGLGRWAGTVANEVGYARSSIERAIEGWLRQGVDMLQRLNALVAEQQASSVIGAVGTGPSAQAILGGAAVVGGVGGGFSSYGTPISSVVGGSAVVGGVGSGFTSYGENASIGSILGGTAIVGGTYFGDGITPMGGGTATIGGSSGDLTGTMALAAAVQRRQERMNATIAAMQASGGATGFAGGMDPITAAQTTRQFGDLMARQGIGTSLIVAPSGSRITSSSSASAGYEITGTYGSSRIESPIKYD